MNFGQALENVKQGKRIARKGWNGKGMFVIKISFKDEMCQGYDMQDCLGLKTANDVMQTGWIPSTGDLFAEDWEIAE